MSNKAGELHEMELHEMDRTIIAKLSKAMGGRTFASTMDAVEAAAFLIEQMKRTLKENAERRRA